MRLQVKKLEGPDEIRLNTNTDTSYTAAISTSNANEKFTCYLNRALTATDVFPTTATIKVYNDEGTLQNTFSLPVNRNNINDAALGTANFCFTVRLNCPRILSGSYFHVHAVLLNTVVNAQNVSYDVSSYHETIKKVFIYAQKQFEQVYWSSSEEISYEEEEATQESLRAGDIGQNEDAFLHIKTIGMYKDNIAVILTVDNDWTILRSAPTTMRQNRRVIAFDMAEVIQRYRQQTGQLEGDVSFTLKAWIAVRSVDGIMFFSLPTLNNNIWISGEADRILPAIGRSNTMPSLIIEHTGELNVTCADADPATKRTSTGTVYVNVNTGETPDITPTKFRDFTIGFMCHIEGIGREVNLEDNNQTDTPFYTVYPFHVYEIMLSDLIVLNIITIEEAIALAPLSSSRNNLESTFNKFAVPLSNNRQLINLFRDNNNRADGTLIRKLLLLIKAKQERLVMDTEICRDAWQKVNSKGVVQERPDALRYNKNKECPLGDYFLNYRYLGQNSEGKDLNKYRLYISKYTVSGNSSSNLCSIDTFHPLLNSVSRGEIAIHQGGSRFSTGCLTFNVPYGRGNNSNFNNLLYSRSQNNNSLNFICIDERNAIAIQDDTQRIKNTTYDFHRYYDLIDPNSTI